MIDDRHIDSAVLSVEVKLDVKVRRIPTDKKAYFIMLKRPIKRKISQS